VVVAEQEHVEIDRGGFEHRFGVPVGVRERLEEAVTD
jgi:hypothetical protein